MRERKNGAFIPEGDPSVKNNAISCGRFFIFFALL